MPKSDSPTMRPRIRFMWWAASGAPRSLRISLTYSGRMKKAMGLSGGGMYERVGESDFGTVWSLRLRLDAPGPSAQGDFDLEVEVPRLVYEILEIEHDRRWEFSIHRGSIHVLPT